ncbi:uncharacterized protein PHALS_08969 [Plasmopara halstedii]|uniref:Uncharacterized protein n=1 Tax=Plasmopara halstedii TaxID=4781 RepID=A0A0P1AE64_PLAHL|nr:uncharacterized protein PHALS_08969 [Plasmopara halstedii]CEG38924.1 hypothetical protein PHALS_08969 [Plasmopara halstedii]|eukprot:XP_024575293.1 hypothetical protein PHALS_08969 [Plasmopara halstedii]
MMQTKTRPNRSKAEALTVLCLRESVLQASLTPQRATTLHLGSHDDIQLVGDEMNMDQEIKQRHV